MTDDEKKAGIDAGYLPVIRKLIAKKGPLANFAALLVASASVQSVRAEAYPYFGIYCDEFQADETPDAGEAFTMNSRHGSHILLTRRVF
jgi:hypothetical protein